MSRYASAGGGPVGASQEFKQMVKALHKAGIEVYSSSSTLTVQKVSSSFMGLLYLILLFQEDFDMIFILLTMFS